MNEHTKKKVPIIVGPTGVGKTRLSLVIASQIKSEIISADSRQISEALAFIFVRWLMG